jgi:hypothetical protein
MSQEQIIIGVIMMRERGVWIRGGESLCLAEFISASHILHEIVALHFVPLAMTG